MPAPRQAATPTPFLRKQESSAALVDEHGQPLPGQDAAAAEAAAAPPPEMTIGILQADSVREIFQPYHGNYPGMFEGMFSAAAARQGVALNFRTYDVEHGDYPDSLDDCDAYVISGSRRSVYEEEPWIARLGAYVQQMHEARKKTLGVCFGHQLVAHVLGGEAAKAEAGWGVGVHTTKVLRRASFMQPPLPEYNVVVSHQDQVLALPKGGVLLAGSDFCPHAMFQVERHILCMQGHPEFDPFYAAALINWRQEILGPEKHAAGLASLEGPLSRATIADWMLRFALELPPEPEPEIITEITGNPHERR